MTYRTPTHTTDTSPLIYARVAGLLYLIIFIAAPFAEFFVRSGVIVPGDATATATNIMASESLFRLSFASDLLVFVIEVVQSAIFYVLLRPVSKTLARIVAYSRLAMAAILGLNLLNHFMPLLLLSGADYLTVFEPEQLYALVLLALNVHGYGYDIAMVFFALHTMALGYAVFKSGYFPRILGILLTVASLSYMVDSFTAFLFPSYAASVTQLIIAPTVIAELSFTLWLLFKGVNIEQWQERALASA